MAREAKKALTSEAFGKFLRWLSADDELAVREYQSIRRRLVRYFIHRGCADPDELFDKTVDILVGRIEACGEVISPLAYCYGVARNVWRENARERRPVPLNENMVSIVSPNFEYREHELKCLEHCMGQLSPSDRDAV